VKRVALQSDPPWRWLHRGWLLPALLLLCLRPIRGAEQSVGANFPPIGDPDQAGQELAARIRSTPAPDNSEFTGALRILTRDGATRTVPVSCSTRTLPSVEGKPAWEVVYRALPADGAPAEILWVRCQAGRTNDYYYIRGRNTVVAPAETNRVCGGQAQVPLAGSDFWLTDLSVDFLHWPKQRVLKSEMRRGRPCRVLESTQPAPPPGGYARVRSWVDLETDGILQAEAYDQGDKLLKDFSIGSVKKVDGEWQLQDMRTRNLRTGSRTWLEYDLKKRE
jgi:hypothetical protein